MDALDARILQQLGVEPFAGLAHRPQGLRASDVARALGRNVRLVQDRITRMEQDGVITGHLMVPNPRHFGLHLTTVHVPTKGPAGRREMEALADLDGFVQVIAYLGQGLCLSMSHASEDELVRRMNNASRLAGDEGPARRMYVHDLPEVTRPLTHLDWRIIAAFAPDAKRTAEEVAEALGVTPKTVRNRLKRMRDEGSVDEVVRLDFARMQGLIPFELAVWCEDPKATLPRLIERLQEHYWGHFVGPPDGYCTVLFRLFAQTPAEAHDLVGAAARIEGVSEAAALMAAGAHEDTTWMEEAMQARLAADAPS